MTDQDRDYKKLHDEYQQRIQEARERGDRATEQQLQQELNYIDDAQSHHA